ncbi:MAG: hypothetical protein IT548_02490 [Alphaproteobacteria bacterium]|nr:hypothetical protein [Alphaproteobacteria bacterium]
MVPQSTESRVLAGIIREIEAKTGFLSHKTPSFVLDVAWTMAELLRAKGYLLVQVEDPDVVETVTSGKPTRKRR